MQDEPNLRMLVMKKAASGAKSPLLHSSGSLISSRSQTSHQTYSSGYSNGEPVIQQVGPVIQQVGPDFSKLSRELNRVVLKIQHQAEISADCPMHSHETSESRRGSRVPDYVRRRSKEQDSIQEHRRSLSGSLSQESSRMGSREALAPRGSLIDSNYQSLPRRLNKDTSSKVDRRQSFQDYKTFRDKFVGKLEFKDTLRRTEESKRPERERERARRGRHFSDSRDYVAADRANSAGGYFIESDFDFRSPPSTRDNSRDRKPRFEFEEQSRRPQELTYASPRRGQADVYSTPRPRAEDVYATPRVRAEEIYASTRQRTEDPYASMRRKELKIMVGDPSKRSNMDPRGLSSPVVRRDELENLNLLKDPLSPRRVEFAVEVFGPQSSRPGSRCESPVPKSILRHTNSDSSTHRPLSASIAVRSTTSDLSSCQTVVSRPTTLIIPTDGSTSFSAQHFNSQISIHHQNQEQSNTRSTNQEQSNTKSTNQEQGQSMPTNHEQSNIRSTNQSGERPADASQDQLALPAVITPATPAGGQSNVISVNNSESTARQDCGGEATRDSKQRVEEEMATEKKRRNIPPPLSDWNRSQSFPQGNGELKNQLRKTSDPLGLSTYSVDSDFNTDIDLIRSENSSLRRRVGDLERQVVDNNVEIKCLKATLAECLRRIDDVEHLTRFCGRGHEDERKLRPMSASGMYATMDPRLTSFPTRA